MSSFFEPASHEQNVLNNKFNQEGENDFSGQVSGQAVTQVARYYQDELYKIALRENVIIFLGTGLGKTYIPVMYLKSPMVVEEIERGRKLVFLAPSRDLLRQQAEYIKEQLSTLKPTLRIKVYCAGKMDYGSGASWRREMANVDVLFMIPDIFVVAIATNLLDWRQFFALVIDECHHAYNSKDKGQASADGSAYRSILLHYRDYYADKPDKILYPRPRLIGLTASLINSMPKDGDSVGDMVSQLERLFHGRCVTDLSVEESRPTVITHGYTPFVYTEQNDSLTEVLVKLKGDITKASNKLGKKPGARNRQNENIQTRNARPQAVDIGLSIKLENLPKIIDHLLLIRARCGLWALELICSRIIRVLNDQSKGTDTLSELGGIYSGFTSIIRAISSSLKPLLSAEDQLLSFSSPKLMCLLDILRQEYLSSLTDASDKVTFSCVIFIRNRVEVVAVHSWLSAVSRIIPQYKFIKCDHALGLAGGTTSKCTIAKRKASDQAQMLDDLRVGRLNVVVTTAVLEEGIDLPNCSTVIRYDLPDNFREYVQSRGRARQQISSFVVMCEEFGRNKVEAKLKNLNSLENDLKLYIDNAQHRRPDTSPSEAAADELKIASAKNPLEEVDIYHARNNAVRIGPKVASQILNQYCQSSKHLSEGLKYIYSMPKSKIFRATIIFPAGCPLKEPITGRPKLIKENAKNSADLATLEALIRARELNDNGTMLSSGDENLEEALSKQATRHLMDQTDLQHSSASAATEGQATANRIKPHTFGLIRSSDDTKLQAFCPRSLLFDRKSSSFLTLAEHTKLKLSQELEKLTDRLKRIRLNQ